MPAPTAFVNDDSDTQASLVLTVGSIVWKGISYWEHADFLLSIREEKFQMMFDFLDSAGWAILLAIGLGWLYWARLIKNRSDVEKRPGWKMVFSCAVVAFLFGVLIALRASGGVPAVVTTWGGSVNVGGVVQCNAIIDTSRLSSFKGKYKLVLICGMQDATVDILDNKEIMVSNSFEIEPRGVGIV